MKKLAGWQKIINLLFFGLLYSLLLLLIVCYFSHLNHGDFLIFFVFYISKLNLVCFRMLSDKINSLNVFFWHFRDKIINRDTKGQINKEGKQQLVAALIGICSHFQHGYNWCCEEFINFFAELKDYNKDQTHCPERRLHRFSVLGWNLMVLPHHSTNVSIFHVFFFFVFFSCTQQKVKPQT